MASQDADPTQETFKKLKQSCVPLLGNSNLTPASTPLVSKLLTDLIGTLCEAQASGHSLNPSLISYVFYPISTILRRNALPAIPDQILEKLLTVLAILCETWWWDFDEGTWEQIFMLSSSIIGGIEGKGKAKERSDETKEAAAHCLWAILHERMPDEDPLGSQGITSRALRNTSRIQTYAQAEKFLPVIGQTVNSLLNTAHSPHRPLQKLSLNILQIILKSYLPDRFVPSILPGVVSSTCKISLGVGKARGWENGDIVAASLAVMQEVIIRSIGDDVCMSDGAVGSVGDLEELAELYTESGPPPSSAAPASRYFTTRTSTWLTGTASQLHIALNSLTPLVNHPTPSALLALATFSSAVLAATSLTLTQSQALLLSFLLSLTNSQYDSISKQAKQGLQSLLDPTSDARHIFLQVLLRISKDNLASLPRLIPLHSDAKVEHSAGIIEAICNLAIYHDGRRMHGATIISTGVGKLLGPNGGIEKWGWSLLSVLEFDSPPVTVTSASAARLTLESGNDNMDWVPFPELTLKHVSSRSTNAAVERMFRSLGRAAGEDCMFAVEWFLSVGQSGRSTRSVAALWCASRLLEGISGVSLVIDVNVGANVSKRSKRFEKFTRALAQSIAELWDENNDTDAEDNLHHQPVKPEEFDSVLVEHVTGLIPVRGTIKQNATLPSMYAKSSSSQPILHCAISLQLLSIVSAILQVRFTPLLLHTLYPILHSLIASSSLLSTTALATLQFIANSTSYASPANMLLSNFDYALDAVSRRLTRRWLDVDATSVLVMLVRLVGRDVVQKAGDVVEECFDRLDEYHGYEVIVDGLIAVLAEVVEVVATDEENGCNSDQNTAKGTRDLSSQDDEKMANFLEWFLHRHDVHEEQSDETDHGPYPREAWRTTNPEKETESSNEPIQNPNAEPSPTPTQELTKQIVSRSMYFLTHSSPLIRARILTLLSSAASVLPESALLPSIHQAWPFILNRFADPEPFVVSAAATLVESLATHVGQFMYLRIWDDIWPRFRVMLNKLDTADATNALARRGEGAVGTESAYTHSHRLYKAILRTMIAAVDGVQTQDTAMWEVIIAFRRFLHSKAHEELQAYARELYKAISHNNEDAAWFALSATQGQVREWTYLRETKWDIANNVTLIFA